MRAIVIHQFTDPQNLKLEELPTPTPQGHEVLISIKSASINPSDVKNISGKMHGTTLPRIPGRDFAGVVVQGPPDLLNREVFGTGGDISRTRDGSHAEFLLLPKSAVTLKPQALPMDSAGIAGLSYITAWSSLVTAAQLTSGETAVIFGATGGTGSAAVQIARYLGAKVLAVVRSNEDFPSTRADGAHETINSTTTNVSETIKSLTQGHGAQVLFDGSGMLFPESIESAALNARIPIIAAPPDGNVTFNLRTLYRKVLRVLGVDTLNLDATTCAQLLAKMLPAFTSGQFHLKPPTPIPLSSAPQAYAQSAKGGPRIALRPDL